MTIDKHKDVFAGMPVKDWPPGEEDATIGFRLPFFRAAKAEQGGFEPTTTIYRLGLSFEETEKGMAWADRLNAYLDQPKAEKTVGIGVGGGADLCGGDDSSAAIEALVNARDRLPNLTALFLGDVTFEDCEISWITQTDVSPLLSAYPNLRHFGVRGSNNLS